MKMSRLSIYSILIFFFIVNVCFSQTKKIDSLRNLLKNANDTTQVNIFRGLSKSFRFQDTEKAIEYGLKSLERSRQINFTKGEIKALYDLGLTHGMTGNYPESLDFFNKCLSISKKNKDYLYIKMVYNSLGIVYKRIGDYPTSKSYYLKTLKLVDSLNLTYDVSSAYSNLGILYDLMGEPDMAIESYEKALEIYKGPDRKKLENNVQTNIAIIDFNKENYKAALDKFLRRQAYAKKQNDKITLCIGYSNIGACYLNLGQWDAAETNFNKAFELAEQLSLKQQIPVIYNGLADLMLKQRKYKEAIQYSNKNIEALNSLEGSFEQKREAHQKAYEIYEADNQLKTAILHLNKTMAFKDSLMNETKVREIQNLQIQHDVYVKDREIEANELQLTLLNTRVLQNRKRMIYFIVISILLLLSASLLFFRYRSKQKSNALLREKNSLISEQKKVIEEINAELEKRMLRAQMNPHFIFNSLSSIQYLISSNDKKRALIYLSKFSKLLRQVLESSININLVLNEEIELLKIYIELEALRFDNSFSYTFTIHDDLDIYEYEVPMLLVQPYIENAIIHGLMQKKGSKHLTVSFKGIKDYIECIIEDNGVGLTSKTVKKTAKHPSRGMSITAKRINALKEFSNQELVTVQNLENEGCNGTRVTILIPKN
ncbi:hypothetical protein DKG77_12905 [Flagellimonas aquimarina]|uniref:Signal transduction histidine kinase internal region domain-containing protein n=2 Tax=Flagellimonas aquimarina TaxID=2201895 RepID=A0A316KY62_9FLAO|nr:hypothetical protein DKG77_12905 [Allomuricauda koreensis]